MYAFPIPPIRGTCPAHFIPDTVTSVAGEECKLWII